MLAGGFQTDIPLNMFVFPAVPTTYLEPVFSNFAVAVPAPLTMAPELIDANRERWLNEWQAAVR
jgi:thiamine transport system substrate-binding protein